MNAALQPYELFAEVYDRRTDLRAKRAAAEYLIECASPRIVLDLACGTGNQAIAFAQRGCKVVAIDRSSKMLAQARSKSETAYEIEYRRQSLDRLALTGERYDVATCMSFGFAYLNDETLVASLSRVANALAPRGLLLFDLLKTEELSSDPKPRVIGAWSDWSVTERVTVLDRCRGEAHFEFRFVDSDSGRLVGVEIHRQRFPSPESLGRICAEAGFARAKIFDHAPWDAHDRRRRFVIACAPGA